MTNTTPNRRKGPDLLLKLLTGANVAAAAALFGAFCLTGMAKPEVETFFDRFYNLNLNRRPNWDSTLLSYIGILLLISGLISIFGLYINSKRRRRKGDYIRATQIVSLIFSIFGLALYLNHIIT